MATRRFNDPIELMTLSNMRENGERSLAVSRRLCHLEGALCVTWQAVNAATALARAHSRTANEPAIRPATARF
jgi:hypothetical protein